MFVELVRKYRKKTHDLDRVAQFAIKDCMKQGILTEFLTLHAKEVVGMLKTEITMEEFLEMERKYAIEDGIEIGMERGMAKGILQTARAMKAEGMDADTIAKITGLSKDDIRRL